MNISSLTRRILMVAVSMLRLPTDASAQDQQPYRQLVADVPRSGFSLRSDGRGFYRAQDSTSLVVEGHYGFALCMDRSVCSTLPEAPPSKPGDRHIIIDLSRPIPRTGAVKRGLVMSANANFGAFWGQDTTRRATYGQRTGWVIRSLLDLPTDSTISSERVELRFFLNGSQHVLQFGQWVAGQYQPRQGPFHGDGTTRASITRTSADRWIVRSGPSAIGRLWDNSDPAHPRDLGLYAFTFEVVFTGRCPPSLERNEPCRS